MLIVVSYDVVNDKRRTKIHKALMSYGQWMQYSVFECDITQEQYLKLRQRLDELIDDESDNVRFYFLCEACEGKIERIGGRQPLKEGAIIV